MIPYGQHSISDNDVKKVLEALSSERITQGKYVDEFEQALCDYFGCKYAVALNNGTTALTLAYQALGVEPGDEVITSPNTFVATANAVLRNGGRPVFVDIDSQTGNLNVDRLENFLESPENRENLVGIAPVHFAGLPCEMDRIRSLANKYDLFVLEDGCHAPGAEWKDSTDTWRMVGSCSHSDAAILSFHPVKHITTGEGGVVLTNNQDLARSVRKYRHHGITKNDDDLQAEPDGPWYYEMQEMGINGRITDIQCALGLSQLQRLDDFLDRRREIAERYREAFSSISSVEPLNEPAERSSAYHLFVIRNNHRDQLFTHLQQNEISPQVHYIPVTDHPYYRTKVSTPRDEFPNAREHYQKSLSLPIFPDLESSDIKHVIDTIEGFKFASP